MTIHHQDLREEVLIPVLAYIEDKTGITSSQFIEDLLLATAAQETQSGTFLRKHLPDGRYGDGLGLYQQAPKELDELWLNFIHPQYPQWSPCFQKFMLPRSSNHDWSQLPYNLAAATLLARITYYRSKHPLPQASTPTTLFHYYQESWTHPSTHDLADFVRNLSTSTDIPTHGDIE